VDQTQAHLPAEANRFIGREREIAELRRMLRQARALTLCGPGGIGKTRLAVRILSAAADEFPDGTWFVELADLALSGQDAVALALDADLPATGAADGESPTLSVVETYEVAATPPGSLTPRERQIAALIATGRSNKAIAAELSISPTTAARHVANILAKLGFRSFTQIAAWVADRPSRGNQDR
jgi:DNA-binding CsgD family transcriptional regulator